MLYLFGYKTTNNVEKGKIRMYCSDRTTQESHTARNCMTFINILNAELNPIRHLLALVGAHHIVHVSRIRVKTTSFLMLFTKTKSLYIPCFIRNTVTVSHRSVGIYY